MYLAEPISAFNVPGASKRKNLLPVIVSAKGSPCNCSHCNFINQPTNNFCTNCGYPLQSNKDQLALYNMRVSQRKQFMKLCEARILQARTTLYIIAAFSMIGLFYLADKSKRVNLQGFLLLVLSALFVSLGRWSITKPFTSLLISFLVMLSFIAINTWAQFSHLFTTASGVYILVIQCVLIYFLLNGLKAAYRADILEEEIKL